MAYAEVLFFYLAKGGEWRLEGETLIKFYSVLGGWKCSSVFILRD
jgi:hypothetical protein